MTTDTTPHTPSESCLCDACPWAKREQAKQAEREATARRVRGLAGQLRRQADDLPAVQSWQAERLRTTAAELDAAAASM